MGIAPAVCEPPMAAFSKVQPVQSRSQWTDSGGYCGALSVQAIAMSYGAYISQAQVRLATGGGQGITGMVMHYNIQRALDKLKLSHEAWDWKHEAVPQADGYLAWLKQKLAAGHPVVWMIQTKEHAIAAEQPGSLSWPKIPVYTHIEPVWGIFSNHSLDDSKVYPEDVLVHGADYGARGVIEGPHLYRRFDSLVDTTSMKGNCSIAQVGIGKNEYYPCIMNDVGIGYAITGVVEPAGASLPVSLAVDRFDEPDFPWQREDPCELHGVVTAQGLTAGQTYSLLRWDDFSRVPEDGRYLDSAFDRRYTFTAASAQHVFEDPVGFMSNGTTYYRLVAGGQVEV